LTVTGKFFSVIDGLNPASSGLSGKTKSKDFTAEALRRREKLVSFCRVGIAHHNGVSIDCTLSGNARPTVLQTYNCFSLRLCASAVKAFNLLTVG